MTNREYQIVFNGHRYAIRETTTDQYFGGFFLGVPFFNNYVSDIGLYRFKWTAKLALTRIKNYDKVFERQKNDFKPV